VRQLVSVAGDSDFIGWVSSHESYDTAGREYFPQDEILVHADQLVPTCKHHRPGTIHRFIEGDSWNRIYVVHHFRKRAGQILARQDVTNQSESIKESLDDHKDELH
jgi:hypothetical protein